LQWFARKKVKALFVQYIIRPNGEDGSFRENAWVAGLRTNVLF
jgi:hypothetical protein